MSARSALLFTIATAWTALICAQASAAEVCKLMQYATVSLGTDESGGVYIPVTIDGHRENLLIDTGGFVSMLTSSAVDALSLRRWPLDNRIELSLYGGTRIREAVQAGSTEFGKMTADKLQFLVMPDQELPPDLGGTIAPDIMRNYDVELDLAKGTFNLFSPDHCEGKVVYWTHQPYSQVPIELDEMAHITLKVKLDGHEFAATIDTGSSRSFLRFQRAQSVFGWDKQTTDLKVIQKVQDEPARYSFPFKLLTFPGISVSNPDIVLVSDRFSKQFGQPDLIIGMGILRQLHIYIAYHERNLYLTAADAN